MNALADLVIAAQNGNVEAYGRLVQATQTMAYAVALSVLRDPTAAQDAAQEAYLRAFRRLGDLQDPAAFAGWLRRIVITVGAEHAAVAAIHAAAVSTTSRMFRSSTRRRRAGPSRSGIRLAQRAARR